MTNESVASRVARTTFPRRANDANGTVNYIRQIQSVGTVDFLTYEGKGASTPQSNGANVSTANISLFVYSLSFTVP